MNYFLAPRSGEKSYNNFQSTIKNGISMDLISTHLTTEEISILSSEDIIYAWGNREGTASAWRKMNIGDTVIFYAKGALIMKGEVYMKKHSKDLALSMWPPDEKGNPWEYTFFIKNLEYFYIPMKVINATVDYKLNFIVRGFIELKEERVQKIIEKYGSVESMFNLFKDENSKEVPSTNDKLHVNIPKEIIPSIRENQQLIPKIKVLKGNNKKKSKKIDYTLKNKNDSITGSKGEELVLRIEKEKLIKANKNDLSKKVKRLSIDDDTLGYDILSFDINGNEKYIEVKTTISNNRFLRFFVSNNEYRIGKNKDNYFIYFVEKINSTKPKITVIKNPIDTNKFSIKPDGYIFEAEKIKGKK